MKYLIIFLAGLCLLAQYIPNQNNASQAPNGITGTLLYFLANMNPDGSVTTYSGGTAYGIVTGIPTAPNGLVTICTQGNCPCYFDTNPPTVRDYVVPSIITSGKCHDAGPNLPSTGQVIGNVSSYPSPASGTFLVDMTLKQTTVNPSGGGSGSVNYGTNSVACTSAPNFNLNSSLYSVQAITLTCSVSSMSISNLSPGALVTFRICRDSNNRSWPAWPGTFHGAMNNPSPQASKCDSQSFYSPDGTNLWGNGLGVLNQ